MVFIVNGADWRFDEMNPSEIEEKIESFLDFVDISVQRGQVVQIGDDFQTREMHGELSLWDMLGVNSDLNISGELRQAIAAWLGPAEFYADSSEWPDGADVTEISIGADGAVENADVSWVHHCLRAGRPSACISLHEAVLIDTSTIFGSINVHFLSCEQSRKKFWRNMIEFEGDNAANLLAYATRAFPDVYFADGVLSHVNHIDGGYLASRDRIKAALVVLDDWGKWVFTCPPPAASPEEVNRAENNGAPCNDLIKTRFAGFGLNAAPEKPNVHKNKTSREARETEIGGRTLYCEWHIKLELHRNRIHVHSPVIESCNRIVVGMIADHLPLP